MAKREATVSAEEEVEKLQKTFAALQKYFSPSRKQEGTGNSAQLVLFAEHAAKVFAPVVEFLIEAHRKLTGRMDAGLLHRIVWSFITVWTLQSANFSSELIFAKPCSWLMYLQT